MHDKTSIMQQVSELLRGTDIKFSRIEKGEFSFKKLLRELRYHVFDLSEVSSNKGDLCEFLITIVKPLAIKEDEDNTTNEQSKVRDILEQQYLFRWM